VTWEDQQRINEFGRLNNAYRELRAEIGVRKTRMSDIENADMDLMNAFDAEFALVQVGEVFVGMDIDSATTRLAAVKAQVQEDTDKIVSQKKAVMARMEQLKKELYARLKDAVYLEYSDDEE